jgi:acyl-CoA synthetase (AMP-forming)/AMP-acid ligase II
MPMSDTISEAKGWTSRRTSLGWTTRWDDAHAAKARADGWWTNETIGERLATLAAGEPNRLLVIDGDKRLLAGELYEKAQILARVFVERGFEPGDVISFMLPNWHETCIIYLGATLAGLVAHPLVTAYREAELRFFLADSGSRMIFVPRRVRNSMIFDAARAAVADYDNPPEIVLVRDEEPGFTSLDALLATKSDAALPSKVDPDAVRMVCYTSGTTGRPKGVLHTHNTIAAAVGQIHKYWQVNPGDSFFVPSPISHMGGSIYAFEIPILYGTVAVLQEMWDAEQAITKMDEHRCTHMAGATPFLQGLLAQGKASNIKLPALRVFICGGAAVPPTLIREAHDWFAHSRVQRVFGSTEVPTITIGSFGEGDFYHAAETDGMIGISTVKLIDADGKETRTEGEVLAKGPQMFLGYLHDEDNAASFDDEGFFKTGDIAVLVDDHYLRISGRLKDIIIRQGENIAPKEIEDLLIQHPDIADVTIVGLPSPKTGELACAVIVPRGDAKPDVATLREFLEEKKVAKYKMPERVELWQELPRSSIGKVLKVDIRQTLINSGS